MKKIFTKIIHMRPTDAAKEKNERCANITPTKINLQIYIFHLHVSK